MYKDLPTVITVTESGEWDMSDVAISTQDRRQILTEVAEMAIALARRTGADEVEVEALRLLLEHYR